MRSIYRVIIVRFIILFALLLCSSCAIIGMVAKHSSMSVIKALNSNNHIDFFQKDWSMIYKFGMDMNPGYYVFDCGKNKPDVSDFHEEHNEVFESSMQRYMKTSEEFFILYNKDDSAEGMIAEEYYFDFSKPYLWKWYVETYTKEDGYYSVDYFDFERKDKVGIMDQVFVIYDPEVNCVYAVSWYC